MREKTEITRKVGGWHCSITLRRVVNPSRTEPLRDVINVDDFTVRVEGEYRDPEELADRLGDMADAIDDAVAAACDLYTRDVPS